MKKRVLTSVGIVVILSAAFLLKMVTPFVFDCLIGMLGVIAAVEVSRVLERDYKFNNVYLAAAFVPFLYIGVCFGILNVWRWDAYLLFIFSLVIIFLIASYLSVFIFRTATKREMSKYMVRSSVSKYALTKTINTFVVFIYPTMLFMAMWFLNHFVELPNVGAYASLSDLSVGFYVLLSAVLISVITDTFAMLSGMLFKGPKLAPKISPNKTISGAIGGIVGGVVIAFVVFAVMMTQSGFVTFTESCGFAWWHVLLLGFLGSIISQIGDLIASFIKRHARVKDYGSLFPGHGGVMDRVDGLIFNSAFVLIFMLLVI